MLLIPKYSIYGAVIGSLISHAFLFAIHQIFAKFIVKEKYEYKFRMFITGLLVLIIFAGAFYVLMQQWIIRWMLALLIGIYILVDIIKKRSIF